MPQICSSRVPPAARMKWASSRARRSPRAFDSSGSYRGSPARLRRRRVGILIAYAAIRLLLRLNPGNIPRLNETSLDLRVLLFALAISILTGVVFGILPALGVSRTNLSELLKQGGNKGVAGASKRWRHGLIVGEVALAMVLLTGSGLLVRSYVNLQNVSTGFSDSTLTMHIALGFAL